MNRGMNMGIRMINRHVSNTQQYQQNFGGVNRPLTNKSRMLESLRRTAAQE